MRGTLFWGPYNKDPTNYLGYYIRVPYFRKLPFVHPLAPRCVNRVFGCFVFLSLDLSLALASVLSSSVCHPPSLSLSLSLSLPLPLSPSYDDPDDATPTFSSISRKPETLPSSTDPSLQTFIPQACTKPAESEKSQAGQGLGFRV